MKRVTWGIGAWAEYQELADDDSRKQELQDIVFELVEHGPTLFGSSTYVAYPTSWPVLGRPMRGHTVELHDRSGFIAYFETLDREVGEYVIRIGYLIWYP